VNTSDPRPILVFDGDCAFCSTSARFAQRWIVRGRAISVEPWQQLDLVQLGLTEDQCLAAVQWVGEGGQVASGHAAFAAILRAGHPVWRPVGVLLVAPGLSWVAGKVYAWLSAHRYQMPGGTPACRVQPPNPPT
jgi:predicted DCC family thiol-disulfide oxidoreductase YuxK